MADPVDPASPANGAPTAAVTRALEPSATARNALVVIAAIAVGAALRWMGGIITPLLLALFLLIMVDGLARTVRRRIPAVSEGVATAAALLLAAGAFAASAWVVAAYAGDFVDKLTGYGARLDELLDRMAAAVGAPTPPSIDTLFARFDPGNYIGAVAEVLQNFASNAVLVLIYLGFLIASRAAFESKLKRMFRSEDGRQGALRLMDHVRDSVERYLWIQTVTGLMIALASWVVMALAGLDNAFFWAFLIFVVNYVPIVGAAAGILLPALFGLVQFDDYVRPLILLLALWAITFVVGNVILPRMQGDSLNMDPVIVLLSLAFWGAIWGMPGMFMSTPLTVLVMVILAQFEGARWIAILLSADGDPDRWRETPPAVAAPP
ncbi:AI-2E family transporter [Caulobacter sp. KR2-114]|uniref:AI-2E family transporter n=1 Tax=Caulobacter sp. KR2-114 TaxID=3400912 RepID=UPI003C0FDFF6